MWIKTIIVDKSIKVIKTRNNEQIGEKPFSYGFIGFDDNKKAQWTNNSNFVKLYDSTTDAITDAKILKEELPVDVLTFNIDAEHKSVSITKVIF